MKRLKKLLCVILTLSIVSSFSCVYINAYNVGDVIGKILSTDIVTYVEGVMVPSYNINGRTAIVAQDLRSLGKDVNFGVNFDEATRALTITDTDVFGTGSHTPLVYADNGEKPAVGTPVGDVLFTDITTNFEGVPVESFNIGGLTCIFADDLGKFCGTYIWDEEARTVNVFRNGAYVPYAAKVTSGRGLPAEETVISRTETLERWAKPSTSQLIKNSDGTFTAFEVGEHINLETYDSSFNLISSFAIKKELPIFGALCIGKDYNYVAYGQENLLEDNSREVIRIVIYDKNFVKISEIPVSNCKTAIPFDASGASMSENEKYLVLHTSRSQYCDEYGARPQTQLTVIIDKSTWKVSNMLGKYQYNHISHALQEFVKLDGDRIITANYSDAAPLRGAFLQELDSVGKVCFTQSIFVAGGALAANCTGGMIGGLEVSDKGYLVPLSTIDHSIPTSYGNFDIQGITAENRDIYLLWTDKLNLTQRHTCLARYTGVGLTGSVPYIVKLSDGNFMVLWQRFFDNQEESNQMCYAFVDPDGNQIGTTYTVSAQLSECCVPIETDGKVVWYVNTESGRDFYSVNSILPQKKEEPAQSAPVTPVPEKKVQEAPAVEQSTPETAPVDNNSEINREEENINTEVEEI